MQKKIENDEKKSELEPEYEVLMPEMDEFEQQEADELSNLRKMFHALGGTNVKLHISRLKPSWCSGHLEELDIDTEDPISIDYLIKQWGGEVLRLKLRKSGRLYGSTIIDLKTWPPLRYGRPLRAPYDYPEQDPKPAQIQQYAPSSSPQALGTPGFDIVKLLQMMQATKKNDIGVILQLMQSMMGQQQQPQQPAGFEQMMGMMTAMREMKNFMADFSSDGGGGGGNSDDVMPMINNALSFLASKSQNAQPAPPAAPPRPQSNPPARRPVRLTADAPPPPSHEQLVNALAGVDPADAAEIVAGAFVKMSPDQRQAAMQNFTDLLPDRVDFGTELPDNYDEDDYYDEADESASQGGRPSSEQGNDPHNRPGH